ncbi:hypothetical protein [Myroides sp. N17-2]|uniref:hypothetical protein n=1 Tax=Myroides sp. N17-2 TaxID=2030799 RepID=UPI000EFBE3C6|nr:hypothetical protein [Myroides sp. N17-2]
MYRLEFTQYNGVMKKMMDEQMTLEVHLSEEFDDNIPKEFLSFTPRQWAEYAFKNDKGYTVNCYKDDKPYCQITSCMMYIAFHYYDSNSFKPGLKIVYFKVEDDMCQRYSKGKVFLTQVTWYGKLAKTLMFYSSKKKDNVFLDEWVIEDGKTVNIEQYGTGDLSQHWFKEPEHCLDFEHLLDYQMIFEKFPSIKR